MSTKITKLKNGEGLVVRTIEPPLIDYALDRKGSELLQWCWPDIRDDVLSGHMNRWLYTPYFLGEIDGELVASMTYYTPRDTQDVGVVEFVQTTEAHRRKGIASVLMKSLIEEFNKNGGLALYLCTVNPDAGTMYEKNGFWYHVGDGMRYLSEKAINFDDIYLIFSGDGLVRDVTWADLPRLSVLYNHHAPKWLVKDYLTQTFHNTRYESHFVKLYRRLENNIGGMIVLESPGKIVVGAAAFERDDTYFEQHVATLSFRISPEYIHQTGYLLERIACRARDLSISILQVYVADIDSDQKDLLASTGFEEEARLHNRIRNGNGLTDMLIYSKSISESPEPHKREADYYGAKHPWQVDRTSAGRDS